MGKFNVRTLVVGENFLFGYKERGDFKLLKRIAKEYGLRIFGVKAVKIRKKL